MRIAVDLDGVVVEYQRSYAYMLRTYFHLDIPPIEEWWTGWDSQLQWGTPQNHEWMNTTGVQLGLYRYAHMVKGARVGMQELARMGHTICIVTKRPRDAVQDTVDWVSLYFKGLPLNGLHILSDGESKAMVQADILIDDNRENIWEWPRRGLLFDQPWNQGTIRNTGVTPFLFKRVHGWKEVPSAVRN